MPPPPLDIFKSVPDHVREHGQLVSDYDAPADIWALEMEGILVSTSADENMTTRIFSETLDAREQTFAGINYLRGSYEDLVSVWELVQRDINAHPERKPVEREFKAI